MNRNRWLVVALLAMLTALCLAFVGCQPTGKNKDKSTDADDSTIQEVVLQSVTVTLANDISLTEGETLSADKLAGAKLVATFSAGEPVEFELSGDLPAGLLIDKLGMELAVGDNTVTVSYAFGGVTKTATFTVTVLAPLPEDTLILEEVPAGTLELNAEVRLLNANAQMFFAYGEVAVEVTAYVTDSVIYTSAASIYARDAIEIAIDKVLRKKGFSENTLSILVDADGNFVARRLADGTNLEETGITAEAARFSLDGMKVSGYKLDVSIPYSLLELEQADYDAAMCLGLTNAYNANSVKFVYASACGEDYSNVYTYARLTEDGTLEANPFVNYGYVWGKGGQYLPASASWNVDPDDGSEEAYITMIGNDYLDNYIYMSNSGVSRMYAEVSINVDGAMTMASGAYDGYPKFGMVAKNANDTLGFGYYVDAVSNAENGEIGRGSTALGYNSRANGGWLNEWSNVGTSVGENSSVYTDGYITMGIYREGNIFVLYYDGEPVKTVISQMSEEEPVYIGLFSFNLRLTAKDYKLVTDEDELAEFAITREDLDYLFIGDSYIDTAFWYNWDNQFGTYSAKNIGVGGTRVGYWADLAEALSMQYNPSNIIVHIGVNDIDDGNTTGSYAYSLLKKMLDKYHSIFEETEIYFITCENNMLFKAKWSEYAVFNDSVRALAEEEGYEWLNIVDMAAYITEDVEGSTMHWFNGDGLHYGVDGYALLNAKLCEALGIERDAVLGETGLGDVMMEAAPEFVYSPGWVLEDGVAHNVGRSYDRIGSESQIFINGLYASEFYAEVKLSVGDCYCSSDPWAKTGLAVRTATNTYFYFINSCTTTNPGRTNDGKVIYTDNYANLFNRPEVINRGWGAELRKWYFFLGDVSYDHNTYNSYKTLGIAKVGNDLILFADGMPLQCFPDTMLGEDEMAAVSVFTFNMDVYAKDAYFTTDRAEIDAKVGGLTLDGELTESLWTEEVLSNRLSFGDRSNNRHIEVVGVRTENGAAFALDVYSYMNTRMSNNWWENANIEFRFGDAGTQRFLLFQGQGFANIRGSDLSLVVANFREPVLVDEAAGVYKTTIEMYVPYQAFIGQSNADAELRFWLWGWVFDAEGWGNIMNVGDWPALTVSTHGLRFARTVYVPNATGATITSSASVARVGDTVTITVDIEDGYELASLTMNGADVELTEGAYTFTMPDYDVAFAASFIGRYSVNLEAVAGRINADNTAPCEGEVVTFTAADDVWLEKLYVNGEELVPDDGVYSITATCDLVVTAETYDMIEGMVLDAKIDAEYGEGYALAEYDDNRDITVYAVKKDSGMFVYAMAHMNTVKSDSEDWWRNTNFEFRLDNGDQRHVNINGDLSGVNRSFFKDTLLESGKHELVFEFYIAKASIPTFANETVSIAYAWKTEGEEAKVVGDMMTGYAVTWPSDWLASHRGGLNLGAHDFITDLRRGTEYPEVIRIGEDGISMGEDPSYATIDGNLEEYANMESYYAEQMDGDTLRKSVRVTGMATDDGLYLAFTIVHRGGWSSHNTVDWAQNDNLEINLENISATIIFINGQLKLTSMWHKGAQKDVDNGDGTITTYVELYAPDAGCKSYAMKLGMNGSADGFNGWFGACWDQYLFVTQKGVSVVLPFPHENYNYNPSALDDTKTAFVVNGVFDDEVYTNTVRANTITTSANGATMSFMGVKTGYGILIAATIVSVKSGTDTCQLDGSEWWHHQNVEVKLNTTFSDPQFAACPWNNGAANCHFAWTMQENGDGTYTTNYEIFVPYYFTQGRHMGYDYKVTFGGVYETGFVWLFGGDTWRPTHRITTEGIIAL